MMLKTGLIRVPATAIPVSIKKLSSDRQALPDPGPLESGEYYLLSRQRSCLRSDLFRQSGCTWWGSYRAIIRSILFCAGHVID